MSSIKKLKKQINNKIGGFIEDVYLWELNNQKADINLTNSLIDESINLFDLLIKEMNSPKGKSLKKHYNSIKIKLESEVKKMNEKLKKLG
tara:strand:+ start:22424 stop:22693 length:270 start_codon:yes stop_codon:yes gene_type:complete